MGKDQELLEAARNGNISVVEKILSQRAKRSGPLASLRRGPGANVQDASGYSALHHAVLNGHKDVVEVLLSHEASPNITDAKGSSPIHLAAWTGNLSICRLLLTSGPSVPNVNLLNQDKETPLHFSAQYGHTEVVSLLLEHGCDPTIRNVKQETALDLAAQYGRLETVETLIRTHPELITAYSTKGVLSLPHSPLHLASRNGHKSVVELLLGSGMDVNLRTTGGTALHEAALCGKLEVVRLLLDSGVDLSLRNSSNNTVYDLLQQFPPHVVQDITALIRRHRLVLGDLNSDDYLPPIPVHSLGSPYENVRFPSKTSPCSSPGHWPDDRRISTSSAMSMDSEEEYWSKNRDSDLISISSTSSVGAPASRERKCSAQPDLYVPMTPSPGSYNKVSPTPPKKPPRRNLSVSPTHVGMPSMCVSGADNAYEYLLLARSGARSPRDLPVGRRGARGDMLRRGKSADQYVDMSMKYSIVGEEVSADDKFQPVAITSVYENMPIRTTNPKRKLRRLHSDKGYENYDPSHILSRGDLPFKKVEAKCPVGSGSMVNGRGCSVNGNQQSKRTLHPLSPTNYQQPPTPDHPPPSAHQAENCIHERIRPLSQEYSEMKRRSRDMETETEDELLLLVYQSGSTSELGSGSLTSVHMSSDQNYVEEYVSDVPFAGLFKGSTNWAEGRLERPTSLSKLQPVYEPTVSGSTVPPPSRSSATGSEQDSDKPDRPPLISPLDDQEEWAKISEIMDSFNSGMVKYSHFVTELEQEFRTRLGLNLTWLTNSGTGSSSPLSQWLTSLGLAHLEPDFISLGYESTDFMNGVMTDDDLREMGVQNEADRVKILEACKLLPLKVKEAYVKKEDDKKTGDEDGGENDCTVDQWLANLQLQSYSETFKKHLYSDMERVSKVWEVELITVLEITKPGHRHRMLASLPNKSNTGPPVQTAQSEQVSQATEDKEKDKEKDKKAANSPAKVQVTSGTGTLRHSHKKSRPAPPPPGKANQDKDKEAKPDIHIRDPSQLLVGVPSTLTTQWRHPPNALVTGHVSYLARYLGSTVVKELRGTESTKKSIQKLKVPASELKSPPDIYLAISYRGVQFLSSDTQDLVCEHEIRNIHCACQDAEDLTHFAYITKDYASKTHYCHVFCVQSMDQATEVILTLGQAFEVAYQMALKEEKVESGKNGHTRSHSANQIVGTATSPGSSASHYRSHSVNEIKLKVTATCEQVIANGHPPTPPAPPKAPIVMTQDI